MKRIISVLVVLSMLFNVMALAVSAEPKSTVLNSTHIVNVTGHVENGDIVSILLKEGEDVKYINEFDVGANGDYRAKFKYAGNIEGAKLQVKQGKEDVTESVVSAVAEKDAIYYQINITNAEGKTLLNTKIENLYNVPNKTYTVALAYYGENNKLLGVKVQDTKDVEFDVTKSENVEYDIPNGTTDVKVFVWDKMSTMIPLVDAYETKTKEISVLMIGHSFTNNSKRFLEEIAAADGVKLNVKAAIYGGGGFIHHWNAWSAECETQEEAEAYAKENNIPVAQVPYKKHYGGVPKPGMDDNYESNMTGFTSSIDDYLEYDYDYVCMVTLEGVYDPDTYPGSADDIAGQNMAKYIREKQPDAEILLFNTWSYEKGVVGSTSVKHEKYGDGDTYDQDKMWEGVLSINSYLREKWATLKTDDGAPISLDGKPIRYIPGGQAFNIARKSYMFDTTFGVGNKMLHEDGFHGTVTYGCHLAGLVWYGCLTGNSTVNNTFSVSDAEGCEWVHQGEIEKQILKEAAQRAIDETGVWH